MHFDRLHKQTYGVNTNNCNRIIKLQMASYSFYGAEYGTRTNRFSLCSHCVWLGSSFLWLSIRYSCVSWVCFGVATFVATCVFMDVLVVSLLHGLICALLHEYLVFKAHCSSGLFCWRTS